MKGFVPTPDDVVDLMVIRLFDGRIPSCDNVILDPGCGTGAFISGIIRWCNRNNIGLPRIVGVESDPKLASAASIKFTKFHNIEIKNEDFLTTKPEPYDYIIGNPPYVAITGLSKEEKSAYKKIFETANGRFDLYILFFEQALKSLKPGGRLTFITPEKFVYVDSAYKLRKLFGSKQICELYMINEETFTNLTTYPMITTLINRPASMQTKVVLRNGRSIGIRIPFDGESWLPAINGFSERQTKLTLKDITLRVSCGVATGADSVFVIKNADLSSDLFEHAYPTISGKQLTSIQSMADYVDSMVIPYHKNGQLIPENRLDRLKIYLTRPGNYQKLKVRTCVSRKPWYAFHENPPLTEILKPKILCKDITPKPHFWLDKEGKIVPRHSIYYIVPRDPGRIEELCEFLNSDEVCRWLEANCQRAANGFLRLQSNVLKCLPVPETMDDTSTGIMKFASDDSIKGDTKA